MGPASTILGSETSANFFSVLGAEPAVGRTFARGEDRPGDNGFVVLSWNLWQSKFHGDPGVLGQVITINETNRQVIGVMPRSFAFPSTRIQFWVPARIDPSANLDYWGGSFVPLVARLNPGFSVQQAAIEIHALAGNIWTLFPWPMPKHWNADTTAVSLQADLAGDNRLKLLILLAVVGVVLAVACANVAGLQLARAASRRKEIAMRAALGAGSIRIIRQLLTENLVLALAAGSLGILLGKAALPLARNLVPADIPGVAATSLDWRVVLFAIAISLLTGLAFGIVPALGAPKLDLIDAMRTGSQRSTTRSWIALRSGLIGSEIALTVILVLGAGLLMKSLYNLTTANPGFDPLHILTVKVSPNQSYCEQRGSCVEFYNRLVQQSRGIPGVLESAAANSVPMDGQLPTIAADVEDHPRTTEFPSPMLWTGAVTPAYFHLMRIPIIAGRTFQDFDGPTASPVILISESTAKHYWPNANPIGKHIRKTGEATWRTIVGVVGMSVSSTSPTKLLTQSMA